MALVVVGVTSLAAMKASCFCGAIRLCVDAAQKPAAVSVCHCQTCRRLTGSPMLANLVLPSSALTVTPADTASLVSLATSKHVSRHRCNSCHSPIYATLGKKVVVPLSLFSPPLPESWQPQHHLYYDRRVLDIGDDLPKYRGHFGGPLWAGEPPESLPAKMEGE